jgi:hypothetical protein
MQLNLDPLLAQLTCPQIYLKNAKADPAGKDGRCHRRSELVFEI